MNKKNKPTSSQNLSIADQIRVYNTMVQPDMDMVIRCRDAWSDNQQVAKTSLGLSVVQAHVASGLRLQSRNDNNAVSVTDLVQPESQKA